MAKFRPPLYWSAVTKPAGGQVPHLRVMSSDYKSDSAVVFAGRAQMGADGTRLAIRLKGVPGAVAMLMGEHSLSQAFQPRLTDNLIRRALQELPRLERGGTRSTR